MLLLLSPAKKLDYDRPVSTTEHTQPLFVKEAELLIAELRTKSSAEMAELMSLSVALSDLNVQRYAQWCPKFDLHNSRQAVLAFNGDVYEGLDAASLSAKQLAWAQDHLAILSGLYGVLRPLDLMQPYRLEMGTRLANLRGKNLYEFWGELIAQYLAAHTTKDKTLINLASEEYFKSVNPEVLKAKQIRVVQCVFQDYKNGAYKVISFNAKRARGLMARYAIVNEAKTPEDLLGFNEESYAYDEATSSADKLYFRRKLSS